MRWRDHTELPGTDAPAIIAMHPGLSHHGRFVLLPQMYCYDLGESRWLGDSNCLPLRAEVFVWLPADEILQTIPR